MLDTQQEIINDFVVETLEMLDTLDKKLIQLEKNPTDMNILNHIFRVAHTIKGTASFLTFNNITLLTHKIEDVFNALRKGNLELTNQIMDVLLDGVDFVKQLLHEVSEGQEEGPIDEISKRLEALLNDSSVPPTRSPSPPPKKPAPVQSTVEERVEPTPKPVEKKIEKRVVETVREKTDQGTPTLKSFSEFEQEIQDLLNNTDFLEDKEPVTLTTAPGQQEDTEVKTVATSELEVFQSDFVQDIQVLLDDSFSETPIELTADQKAMRADFIAETREHLESLDRLLVKVENKSFNSADINELFRSFHTIKGNAGFMQLDNLQKIAQAGEELLSCIRSNQFSLTPEIIDVLLNTIDLIKKKVRGVSEDVEGVTDEQFQSVIQTLETIIQKISPSSEKNTTVVPSPPKSDVEKSKPEPAIQSTVTPKASIEPLKEPEKKELDTQPKSFLTESSIRVEVQRLDKLMDQVGELVTAKNRLQQIAQDLSDVYEDVDIITEDLSHSSDSIDGITADLQMSIMKTRMLQIDRVFSRYPRMIRDLARLTEKELALEISGEDTELDKSVMELISDPLVHLVRNAVDHGLEEPEVRRAQGKSTKGTIKLSAYQEGSHVIIKIEDDGKGIDVEKIREKVLEKKLLSPADAYKLPENQVMNYIFHPGFSTAQAAGALSGRGVGMDVVRSNIEKLNGIIDIDTEIGKGTCITLRIPLTLAITQSLLVDISGETFAIPLSAVFETVRISANEVDVAQGRELFQLREEILTLVRLQNIFSWEKTEKESYYVVLLGLGHRKFGLLVDDLIGQKEVVIKSLGKYLNTVIGTKSLAGATIMGDGSITLIVDVKGLMETVYENA